MIEPQTREVSAEDSSSEDEDDNNCDDLPSY